MRILWIGKRPASGGAGDEIFDERTISALRAAGHHVTRCLVDRVGRARESVNLLAGLPHYRTRYASARNWRLVRDAASERHDVTVCSWEPLDVLAPVLPKPAILVAHNVTSLALPSLFPRNPVAALLALRARAWERRLYRREMFAAIATLSSADRDRLQAQPAAPPILLTPPGMPPLVPLSPDATFRPELMVGGTYEWRPKRRDVVRFARDYRSEAARLAVTGPGWPRAAERLLPARPSTIRPGASIGLGLITDRFTAGHKLKTLAYVAEGRIVLSFSDVTADVSHIPDHAFCIRTIRSAADIAAHARELAALDPAVLRSRLHAFQMRCAAAFTWDAVADALVAAAVR